MSAVIETSSTLGERVPLTPFKGLMPFEDSELDALLFFGREREREIIVANLMASRLTVLYGPSGVGKTSLLRAGVARALREMQNAAVVTIASWAGDPINALRAEIQAAAGASDGGECLADALESASRVVGGEVYVMLDQFEEYFLYHEADVSPDSVVAQVADAVSRPGLRANFLIGIREDALARLDAFKAWIPGPFANSLRLDRLDRAAAEAAILGPVNAYNGLVSPSERREVEPELVTRVLAQVAAGRVDLGRAGRGSVGTMNGTDRIEAPYLQLVLERIWEVESQQGSKLLRAETLLRLGGATRIVEDHLDRAMSVLSPHEQDAAAAMYNHLVTPSGMKIAHGVADLAGYADVDEKEAAAVLRRLSDDRIVRAGENGDAGRYEIFHDVLADAVLAWRTRHQADRVLEEQREAADRRHRRMLVVVAATIGALCVVAALAVYALVQRSDARHQAARADAQRLVAVSQRHKAEAATAAALGARNRARHSAVTAKRADLNAQVAQRNATQQRAKAEKEAVAAETAKRQAQVSAARANKEASRAKTQEARARGNEAAAVRQRRIAQAGQLAADAKALLATDPERSVRVSLKAAVRFRSAGVSPAPVVEDTLREGLVNLRIEAVLRVGGSVDTITFSPGGSFVLVAGSDGAWIFDRTERYSAHRLLPDSSLASAAFSPDGSLVAGGGGGRSDHAVRIWDARSGAVLDTLPHNGVVRDVAFSPDGRLVATASSDGNARVWDVAQGVLLATFPHPSGARIGVWAVSFSPDGRRLLTVGGDRFARVFDIATKKLAFAPLDSVGFVNSARFSHDGRLIATAGNDPFVRIWDARTGEFLYRLAHAGGVQDVAFSPDDSLLATAGGVDTIARVWRLSERSAIAMQTSHLSGVEQVIFTPNGRSVLSRGRDRNVYIWSANGGFPQASLIGHKGPVTDVAVSPDGGLAATASVDGTARVWDAQVNANGPLPPAVSHEIANHGLAVNQVAFSPSGGMIVSAGADGTARLLGPGKRAVILRHSAAVTAASFSQDNKLVITASADGTARIWRTGDGSLVRTLEHGALLQAARFSPNGRVAVTAGADGVALLWDVRRGVVLYRLVHQGAVEDARFSPDGARIVTASADGTAAIWRVSDGRRLATLTGHTAAVVAAGFSPDGQRVATASADSTARIWNAKTGVSEHQLIGHARGLTAIAFSPHGRWLATASLDRDVRVWDVRSGAQVALLRIHGGFVSDVAFSSDGRWLASSGAEAVGIWETKTRGDWPETPLYLVPISSRPTNTIAFSPRGWRIVAGARDGSVRTFDCAVCGRMEELERLARKRLAEIVRPKL